MVCRVPLAAGTISEKLLIVASECVWLFAPPVSDSADWKVSALATPLTVILVEFTVTPRLFPVLNNSPVSPILTDSPVCALTTAATVASPLNSIVVGDGDGGVPVNDIPAGANPTEPLMYPSTIMNSPDTSISP